MFSVLTVVLPIFALIFAGWLARRLGALGPHATGELNRFVVYLALPALLFDIVATSRPEAIWRPDFIAAFGLGAGVVFALALFLRRGRPLADAAIDGLNAAYANTGFIGFPLALAVVGPSALAPTLIATILTVCVLFAMALVLVEVDIQKSARPGDAGRQAGMGATALKVGASLARNPLLIAPVLGALVLASGAKVPGPAESFLDLLGAAASPCALVALGLFLAEKRPASAGGADVRTAALLVGLKLVVQPLATWGLAAWVLRLPAASTHLAVLLAALPTGTGPFMVAEFYRREAATTARVVLVSTIASLATITLYLTVAS